jgi:hypothetical protein
MDHRRHNPDFPTGRTMDVNYRSFQGVTAQVMIGW